MRKKTTLNVRLLRRVARRLLADPRRYDQSLYFFRSSTCGATGCIAGWAVHLSEDTAAGLNSFYARASRLLGLSEDQANNLFSRYPERGWPQPFAARWSRAKSRRGQAQVAHDRIEHLIATGE